MFRDGDEVEVHKFAKKKEQTWSIKDLLYGFWGNFACGIQRAVPSGQYGSILTSHLDLLYEKFNFEIKHAGVHAH